MFKHIFSLKIEIFFLFLFEKITNFIKKNQKYDNLYIFLDESGYLYF
jgi:hypothetical protein